MTPTNACLALNPNLSEATKQMWSVRGLVWIATTTIKSYQIIDQPTSIVSSPDRDRLYALALEGQRDIEQGNFRRFDTIDDLLASFDE